MYKNVKAEKHSPERYTSQNAAKRLLKEHTDHTIKKESIEKTRELLYQIGRELVEEAEKAADHADRKTIMPEDFELAAKHRFKTKTPSEE